MVAGLKFSFSKVFQMMCSGAGANLQHLRLVLNAKIH